MEMEPSEAVWTADLEVGIENLDHQHKKYFELLNDYLGRAALVAGETDQIFELAETLLFLKNYAAEHFADEEQVMTETHYPELDSHRREHEHFLRHVQELHDAMRKDGFSPSLAREVHYYTAEWFVEHIQLTDMEFAQYLKKTSTDDPGFRKRLRRAFESVFSKR